MISLCNVSYKYKNGQEVLKNINLNINDGEFVAIVGKNGSGKSTLGKIISGLVNPSKGEILVDGLTTKDKKNFRLLRERVGIVFQNPENQLVFNNIDDEISFVLRNLGKDNIEKKIEESLSKTKMQDLREKDINELSLGQKQRVAISEVLAVNPKHIVFDEPTTMIDSKGKNDIYNIVKNLKKEGYTIVYITNFADEMLLADKIIVLEEGRIVLGIDKKDILDYLNELTKYEIQIPPVLKLLDEMRNKGIDVEITDFEIESIIEKILEVVTK